MTLWRWAPKFDDDNGPLALCGFGHRVSSAVDSYMLVSTVEPGTLSVASFAVWNFSLRLYSPGILRARANVILPRPILSARSQGCNSDRSISRARTGNWTCHIFRRRLTLMSLGLKAASTQGWKCSLGPVPRSIIPQWNLYREKRIALVVKFFSSYTWWSVEKLRLWFTESSWRMERFRHNGRRLDLLYVTARVNVRSSIVFE